MLEKYLNKKENVKIYKINFQWGIQDEKNDFIAYDFISSSFCVCC